MDQQVVDKLKAIAIKNLNVGGMLMDTMDEILKPALDKMVLDSANPYDDMAVAALYPVLDKAIKEKIAELVAKVSA